MEKLSLKKALQIVTVAAVSITAIYQCTESDYKNWIVDDAISSTVIHQYSRSDYKHWIDADKDCQNTRQEVLISESLREVTLDKRGCKVISGKWYDPYTDKYFTNPRDLDVDHLVPLKEADRSGGYLWDKDRKMKYANNLDDPDILIAVDKSANRSKGAKDPSSWMPSNKGYSCDYIETWKKIKKEWDLKMDEKERKFIGLKHRECQKDLKDQK